MSGDEARIYRWKDKQLQILIRLLHLEQSDLDLHCLLSGASVPLFREILVCHPKITLLDFFFKRFIIFDDNFIWLLAQYTL